MSEDAKETLVRYLTTQREALRWKLDGVSERDARMPMTPTGTNLLGRQTGEPDNIAVVPGRTLRLGLRNMF